jgi:hypothetical protein
MDSGSVLCGEKYFLGVGLTGTSSGTLLKRRPERLRNGGAPLEVLRPRGFRGWFQVPEPTRETLREHPLERQL